jgi:PEP-CTERM motif
MLARGLPFLLLLIIPLAGSATPVQRTFRGPSFSSSVTSAASPVQLTLPPATPAALTFPLIATTPSTPRVLPATGGSSGSWLDMRGSTKLFTGSIPQTSSSDPIPPVPEPSPAALLALGLVLLAARRR